MQEPFIPREYRPSTNMFRMVSTQIRIRVYRDSLSLTNPPNIQIWLVFQFWYFWEVLWCHYLCWLLIPCIHIYTTPTLVFIWYFSFSCWLNVGSHVLVYSHTCSLINLLYILLVDWMASGAPTICWMSSVNPLFVSFVMLNFLDWRTDSIANEK